MMFSECSKSRLWRTVWTAAVLEQQLEKQLSLVHVWRIRLTSDHFSWAKSSFLKQNWVPGCTCHPWMQLNRFSLPQTSIWMVIIDTIRWWGNSKEDVSSLLGMSLSMLQTLIFIDVVVRRQSVYGCVPAGLPETRHVHCTKVTCSSSTLYAVSGGSQWFYLRLSLSDRERGRAERGK